MDKVAVEVNANVNLYMVDLFPHFMASHNYICCINSCRLLFRNHQGSRYGAYSTTDCPGNSSGCHDRPGHANYDNDNPSPGNKEFYDHRG